jgi:hypothetical protein
VGPGEIVEVDKKVLENERAAFAAGATLAAGQGLKTNKLPSKEALDLSMTRIRLARVDPLSTLAVMMQVNDSMEAEDEFAFFQMISRHVDHVGKKLITRVSTHRLPVADDVSNFVSAVDEEVVSVLLAKCAVYRSLHGREETDDPRELVTAGDTDTLELLAYEAQLDLDATVQRISGAFRLLGLEKGTRRYDSSTRFRLGHPRFLFGFAKYIFRFQH